MRVEFCRVGAVLTSTFQIAVDCVKLGSGAATSNDVALISAKVAAT